MDPLDLLSGGIGLVNSAYNLYSNKRDFDYQKAIQQQIFQREDTAVQRRMADLQAAGLNPNLAGGSGAGAGSVVSRSNTNDVNFGQAIDMALASNQLKQQRYQTQIAKNNAETSHVESLYQQHKLLADMGLTTMPYYEDGKLKLLTPDNHYATTTVPLEQSEANIIKARDALQQIFRENNYLLNTINKTTADMIMGKAQISNWSLKNTIDVFNALSGRNLKQDELEIQAEKLGLDIKKTNFSQIIQSLPLILLLLGG